MSAIIDKYRKFNCFVYRDVNFANVIATQTYNISKKKYLIEIIKFLFFSYIKEIKNCKGDIIFFYSYRGKNRADYDEIADRFSSFMKGNIFEYNYNISFYKLKEKILHLLKFWFLYKKNKIEKAFFLSLLTAQYTVYYNEIAEFFNKRSLKLVVVFCDFAGIENLVIQIAKNKKLITATLQHGQYRLLKYENENEDAEAYKNFTSDYLFAWGEATKNEFEKFGINKKRILCVGNLKKKINVKKLYKTEHKNIFGVVLSGNNYHKTNLRLIEIANQIAELYGMKYILRLHPKNQIKYYKSKCEGKYVISVERGISNMEYLEKIDFSILHMTSVFVELLSCKSSIYIFHDEYLEDLFKIEKMCFRNIEEFKYKYTENQKMKKDVEKEVENYYRYFEKDGNIENNYIEAIRWIYKKSIN